MLGANGCGAGQPTLAPLNSPPPVTPTASTLPSTTPSAPPALTATKPPGQAPTRTPSPRPTNTARPTPTVTTLPSTTPPPTTPPTGTGLPLDNPLPVTLQTSDGLALAAALYLPQGDGPFPGALLSHMGGGSKEAWGTLPGLLLGRGYAVLAFDFRGHGGSDGDLDPSSAAIDLGTALAYLRAHNQVDGERIGLVGASMGGMASVIVGVEEPDVRAVVAISTSPDAAGQYPGRVVQRLSPRPFLAIGCDADPLTRPERVRELYDAARPPKRLAMLSCDVHANDILETDVAEELLGLVVMWLDLYVKSGP